MLKGYLINWKNDGIHWKSSQQGKNLHPCSSKTFRNMYTIRLFSIGVSNGAVCILVFTTSKGYINAHVSAPLNPPPNDDAAHKCTFESDAVSQFHLEHNRSDTDSLMQSYAAKYNPNAGTSLQAVTANPLYKPLIPCPLTIL